MFIVSIWIFHYINLINKMPKKTPNVYICNVEKIWDRNVTAYTINSILFDLGKMKIDERWFDKIVHLKIYFYLKWRIY